MVFIIYIIFMIIVGEIYARMSYNRWLYEITHDGIKMERGIIWKKYTSIPFERVQNVEVLRGVIARMIGFSTIEVETAGNSGSFFGRKDRRYESEGHLPAIDVHEAERIRQFIMKKVRDTGEGI
ncbi:PH domain-containing protein [Candidatus Pacearchaeota archaeon]|nr:PH domain-containing protein [Candidatus Pacearchaeota archaeon]